MTHSLAQFTILIVEGRSIAGFKLRGALEDHGAYVCSTTLEEAETAWRRTKPNVVLIDFALSGKAESFAALLHEENAAHLFCSSPNRHQASDAQAFAAQDVAVALADIAASRPTTPLPWQASSRIDPELYAI